MKNSSQTRSAKVIYWISTLWLSLGMISTAIVQLVHAKEGPGAADSMNTLGYPPYVMTILGVWKILGVIILLAPQLPLLKEWAYAGFFFLCSGAVMSHIAAGDAASEIFPALLLLVLTVISWFLRPSNKKLPFSLSKTA